MGAAGGKRGKRGRSTKVLKQQPKNKEVKMADKAKIVKGVVTLGLIVWFLFQVYVFGIKLSKKSTGTLESLAVETAVQYPSIAVCPRPHAKLPHVGTKFPTPEEHNDTCLLAFQYCKGNESMTDMVRNRMIFTTYGSFKICVLFEPTSKCHRGNNDMV